MQRNTHWAWKQQRLKGIIGARARPRLQQHNHGNGWGKRLVKGSPEWRAPVPPLRGTRSHPDPSRTRDTNKDQRWLIKYISETWNKRTKKLWWNLKPYFQLKKNNTIYNNNMQFTITKMRTFLSRKLQILKAAEVWTLQHKMRIYFDKQETTNRRQIKLCSEALESHVPSARNPLAPFPQESAKSKPTAEGNALKTNGSWCIFSRKPLAVVSVPHSPN